MNVYITKATKFLPNTPVGNEDMESYLGMIDGTPSKARRIVLRSNGIRQRYYALDKDGNVGYRILADVLDADGHTVGNKLLDVSIQDAVIYDEDQPDILITVHPGNGTPEFLSKLSKQQKKQVKRVSLLSKLNSAT